MAIFLSVISILLSLFCLFVIKRLNKYIASLEDTLEISIKKNDRLQKSLEKAIKNNLLQSDGGLDLLIEAEE